MVYLASQSPRRRTLLDERGIAHTTIESGIDDGQLVYSGSVSPEIWVAALAFLKASAGLHRYRRTRQCDPAGPVLGADTVVVVDNRVIGQPADQADARRILDLLNDREHSVLTGVALLDPASGRRDLFADSAVVSVGRIPEASTAEYLRSGLWRGKAGAYNLTERIEAGWPISYRGDPGTIMGLPMDRLVDRLSCFASAS